MTGTGPSYQERQRARVQCSECREEMTLGLLEVHLQAHHGKAKGGIWHLGATPPGGELYTYNIAFPITEGPRNCPIEGCRGQAAMRTEMWVH